MKTRPMKRNKNNQRASSLPFDAADLLQHLFRLIKVGKMKDVRTWPHPLHFGQLIYCSLSLLLWTHTELTSEGKDEHPLHSFDVAYPYLPSPYQGKKITKKGSARSPRNSHCRP